VKPWPEAAEARNTAKPGVSVQVMGDLTGPAGGRLAKLGRGNRKGTVE